jgi:hypothetical protein
MPIAKKKLHIGKSYRIDVTADGNTSDVSLMMRGWIAKSGAPAPPGVLTLSVPPGGGDHDQGTVPDCLGLELEWDVPDDGTAKLKLVVTENGEAVVDLPITADDGITIRVIP